MRCSSIYLHYLPSDLPHFHLRNQTSHKTFHAWIRANRRSHNIVGCWSRPLFCGGWQESTTQDTDAYNLQTPSIFIDMRFPTARPTDHLRTFTSLDQCSAYELEILARQHCFSGYSLPDRFQPLDGNIMGEVFTRHHVIDWNYHPFFPRPRPNRWWVEVEEDFSSFKEHSAFRDNFNVPVYFERWQRRSPINHQRHLYLALRKRRSGAGDRDAILVVTGAHFALAVDRDFSALTDIDQAALRQRCSGGGAFFVDYVLARAKECDSEEEREGWLRRARSYLDLEGSCGLCAANWEVSKSSLPWLEGSPLFHPSDRLHFSFDSVSKELVEMQWAVEGSASPRARKCAGTWEVLECSFSQSQLQQLFPQQLRSKL
jgi:hypothetical protein